MKNTCLFLFFLMAGLLLVACAGERQGLVCEEIEYRLNTQTYSPDQRAYIEEELRVCREDEAQKRGADAAYRQSIYDRFAASDSTAAGGDSTASSAPEISVSKALQDTSSQQTQSIYDRYKSDAPADTATSVENASEQAPAAVDSSASNVSEFQ